MILRYETFEGAWPHRPDYVHGPFYDKDVNVDKRLTKEEAIDLVGEHLIRTYEVGIFAPRWTREGLQGITGTWVWTMGGVKPDGSDACNDLTTAYMQAARLVRVSNPTFGFRWHPKVKDEVFAGMLRMHSSRPRVSINAERSGAGCQFSSLARPPR